MGLTEEICGIVRSAGEIILHAEGQRNAQAVKEGHANFVTVYDRQVQEYLIEKLTALLPEAQFLGEEEGKDLFREEYRKGLLFVIDPIDGTSNFMNGLFPSVISVGLFKDGRPYIGVVYNPVSDQMFFAEKGKGAYVLENGTEEAKSLRASEKPLAHSLVSFGTSPYHSELFERTFALAADCLPRCIDLRRSGCAAWDLCMVASGRIGMYFECEIGIWDCAAGVLLVTEAGGSATQLSGEPLTFDGPTSMLACGTGITEEDRAFLRR